MFILQSTKNNKAIADSRLCLSSRIVMNLTKTLVVWHPTDTAI